MQGASEDDHPPTDQPDEPQGDHHHLQHASHETGADNLTIIQSGTILPAVARLVASPVGSHLNSKRIISPNLGLQPDPYSAPIVMLPTSTDHQDNPQTNPANRNQPTTRPTNRSPALGPSPPGPNPANRSQPTTRSTNRSPAMRPNPPTVDATRPLARPANHRTAASQPTEPNNAIGQANPTNALQKTPVKQVRSSAKPNLARTSTPKRKMNEIEHENFTPAKIPRREVQPSRAPKFISNTFTKINGCLQLIKTFDYGIKITTRRKSQNSFVKKFTIKKKKLEIEENASILTPRRRYQEGSRKEKKEDNRFDFRNILTQRRDPNQTGRKRKEDKKKEGKEMKEERKCQELLSPEGKKEEKLLLPKKNLQNLINHFEKFDQSGKKKNLIFEISGDY